MAVAIEEFGFRIPIMAKSDGTVAGGLDRVPDASFFIDRLGPGYRAWVSCRAGLAPGR